MKIFQNFWRSSPTDEFQKVGRMERPPIQNEFALIEEIHNEFDTAPQRLIDEANRILSSPDKNIIESSLKSKADRLKALGFTSTISATAASQIESKIAEEKKVKTMAKELAELVKYYQHTYPFSKFLTIDELNRICTKYSLIHTVASRYIKDIPDKNIAEIENAKPLYLKDANQERLVRLNAESKYLKGYSAEVSLKRLIDYFTIKEMYINDGITVNEFCDLANERAVDFQAYAINPENRYSFGSKVSLKELDTSGLRQQFCIAAPADHFNLEGLKKDGNEYKYPAPILKNDPIVFRYCKGGILVDSKWGLEASDPLLINPINN